MVKKVKRRWKYLKYFTKDLGILITIATIFVSVVYHQAVSNAHNQYLTEKVNDLATTLNDMKATMNNMTEVNENQNQGIQQLNQRTAQIYQCVKDKK